MEGVRRNKEKWANKGCHVRLFRLCPAQGFLANGAPGGGNPAHAILPQTICPDVGFVDPREGGTFFVICTKAPYGRVDPKEQPPCRRSGLRLAEGKQRHSHVISSVETWVLGLMFRDIGKSLPLLWVIMFGPFIKC